MLKDNLIKGLFINSLLYSIAFPTMQKVLIGSVTSKYIALNSLIICGMITIFGKVWNKYNSKLFRWLGWLLVGEIVLYAVGIVSVILGVLSYRYYYIFDTFTATLIGKNCILGYNYIKSIRYKGQERNIFDNDMLVATSIASFIGFAVSFIFSIPVNVAFGIWLVGIILTDWIIYGVYKSELKRKDVCVG